MRPESKPMVCLYSRRSQTWTLYEPPSSPRDDRRKATWLNRRRQILRSEDNSPCSKDSESEEDNKDVRLTNIPKNPHKAKCRASQRIKLISDNADSSGGSTESLRSSYESSSPSEGTTPSNPGASYLTEATWSSANESSSSSEISSASPSKSQKSSDVIENQGEAPNGLLDDVNPSCELVNRVRHLKISSENSSRSWDHRNPVNEC